MKKSRMLASTLCAVLMVGVLTVPAYAGGGGESEGSEYVPWVGLEPVDPLPVEQPPEPQPFTSDGTGTVVDNATDEDGKEFFTITTADEAVFYLVIDRQRSTENVYFLNAVTVSDLMALAEQDQEPEAPPPVTEPDPEPEPDPAPEPEPQKSGGAGMLLAALAVLALGGGAGWYFKIYRPKQQRAAEPEEDHADYDEPDDYDDAPPWDVDDEDEGGDE
ncbi:CD1107 family mobile element protein [Clostridium phoceensis]|uniref:CD1107 family mobile element protein n=1 Tax=Clostridium phoceensis TaxID=1650661 RepID=UPI0023F462CA|nr:DUF4366 domain-containing protein [Clostridium phoceensis]